MEVRRFLSVPVLSVFLLMGFVYHMMIFKFIDEWLGLRSSAGSLNALIFTSLASLCAFSFIFCVLTDPGGVPSAYVPDVERNQIQDRETKRSGVHPRQCDKCSSLKPPRAHHCRVCRRCVLKMDHHCIWINNCVGYRNYKSFLGLVFYAALASIYSSIAIITCLLQKNWESIRGNTLKHFYIFCGTVTIVLSLILGSLLIWHMYLITHNMTTIEFHDGKRSAWLARKSGLNYHHPFDVGVYKNISLVLGPNLLKWLWPAANGHIKDGTSFPIARENDSS